MDFLGLVYRGGEAGLERKFVVEGLHFGVPLLWKSRRILVAVAHWKEENDCFWVRLWAF